MNLQEIIDRELKARYDEGELDGMSRANQGFHLCRKGAVKLKKPDGTTEDYAFYVNDWSDVNTIEVWRTPVFPNERGGNLKPGGSLHWQAVAQIMANLVLYIGDDCRCDWKPESEAVAA